MTLGARQTGQFGQVVMSVDDGVPYTNAELSPVALKTIGGVDYVDRFFGHAQTHWNKDKQTTLPRVQGICSECVIVPGATANTVAIEKLVKYFKDAATPATPAVAAPNLAIAITRPATGKKAQVLILLDTSDGTFTALKGTDGDTLVETFGAAAGQIPLADVGKLIVGRLSLLTDASAVVTASEIVPALSDGTRLQECSYIPTFELVPLEGGVLFPRALPKWHTGTVPRKVFASFYSQKQSLEVAGDTTSWKTAASGNTAALEAQGDTAAQVEPSGVMKSTVNLAAFAKNGDLFNRTYHKRRSYFRGYRNRNDTTEYYECAIVSKSWDENNDINSGIMNNCSFDVDGHLEWRGQ